MGTGLNSVEEQEFRDFVSTRSGVLLHTAYLLTGNPHDPSGSAVVSSDNQIRTALREVPVSLVPSPGLADDVLSALGRQRRMRIVGAAAAIVAILAAVPLALTTFLPGPGRTIGTPPETSSPPRVAPSEPVFPKPGGGPQALHLFVTGERIFLLDPISGEYQAFPFTDAKLYPRDCGQLTAGNDHSYRIQNRSRGNRIRRSYHDRATARLV